MSLYINDNDFFDRYHLFFTLKDVIFELIYRIAMIIENIVLDR